MRQPFHTTLVLTSLLAGCAVPGSTLTPDGPDASAGMGGQIPQPLVKRAVRQAGEEAGVCPGDIEILVAEAVTWSDASLGCPQPGRMYTQALVPGYRVVLRVAGEKVAYHASERDGFFRCATPLPPVDRSVDR